MKTIALRQYGSLEDVEYIDRPVPSIGSQEVLVEIKAAALNRLDFWVIEGWRGLRLQFPHILGCDGSGVIAQIGKDVAGFEIGDRVAINPTHSCGGCDFCQTGRDNMCDRFAVFGEHIPGFYAQFQAVPARNLLKLPNSVSHELASAASLVYVTAWHSLIEVGGFLAGEDILVIGAAGGANLAYIDIARFAGAGTIYVVGSSDDKLALASQSGADVTINRSEEDWGKALFKATGRRGVDIVVDNVGADTYMTSLRSLRKGGRLLTVGNTSGPIFDFDNRYMFGKHLRIIGTTMGPRQDYQTVMKFVFDGRLMPVIDTIYPMEEGLEALRQLEAGQVAGKILLKP